MVGSTSSRWPLAPTTRTRLRPRLDATPVRERARHNSPRTSTEPSGSRVVSTQADRADQIKLARASFFMPRQRNDPHEGERQTAPE